MSSCHHHRYLRQFCILLVQLFHSIVDLHNEINEIFPNSVALAILAFFFFILLYFLIFIFLPLKTKRLTRNKLIRCRFVLTYLFKFPRQQKKTVPSKWLVKKYTELFMRAVFLLFFSPPKKDVLQICLNHFKK
jgi:hypothetical protein